MKLDFGNTRRTVWRMWSELEGNVIGINVWTWLVVWVGDLVGNRVWRSCRHATSLKRSELAPDYDFAQSDVIYLLMDTCRSYIYGWLSHMKSSFKVRQFEHTQRWNWTWVVQISVMVCVTKLIVSTFTLGQFFFSNNKLKQTTMKKGEQSNLHPKTSH